MTASPSSRFLTTPQVAEELATSSAQITALVRRGDLPAVKLADAGNGTLSGASTFILRA